MTAPDKLAMCFICFRTPSDYFGVLVIFILRDPGRGNEFNGPIRTFFCICVYIAFAFFFLGPLRVVFTLFFPGEVRLGLDPGCFSSEHC